MKKIIVLTLIIIPLLAFPQNIEQIFSQQVVKTAESLIGRRHVPAFNGKHFTSDCIGFVRYAFYKTGLNLYKAYGKASRGVSSLYLGLKKRNMIYSKGTPRPGDLIFFDNTYDVNRNGRWDDPLSHIGIVEKVGRWDTISYIHFSNSGVKRSKINLKYPKTYAFRSKSGKLIVINSFLRRNRGEDYAKQDYISAHFFRAFAHLRVRAR